MEWRRACVCGFVSQRERVAVGRLCLAATEEREASGAERSIRISSARVSPGAKVSGDVATGATMH
jgi:hypothetical protein